jgi:hypothetical protein
MRDGRTSTLFNVIIAVNPTNLADHESAVWRTTFPNWRYHKWRHWIAASHWPA